MSTLASTIQDIKTTNAPTSSVSETTVVRSTDISSAAASSLSVSATSLGSVSSPLLAQTSQTVSWGPAITATSTLTSVGVTDSSVIDGSESRALSTGARQVLIVTSVIGGMLAIALLLYAIWRRSKGATASEIILFRPHRLSTITESGEPKQPHLPIYRETRYSVSSTRQPPAASFPRVFTRHASMSKPASHRPEHQTPSATHPWQAKSATLSKYPNMPATRAAPPAMPYQINFEKALPDAPDEASRRSESKPQTRKNRSGGRQKPNLQISVQATTPSQDRGPKTPQKSICSERNLQTRWSWTNSEAPTTPRMYAPSLRSTSSLHALKFIRDWRRAESEDIEGGRNKTARGSKRLFLRNQASKPNLAPSTVRTQMARLSRVQSSRTVSAGSELTWTTNPSEPVILL